MATILETRTAPIAYPVPTCADADCMARHLCTLCMREMCPEHSELDPANDWLDPFECCNLGTVHTECHQYESGCQDCH